MATQSRRFVPRLEALNDRVVPAVSFDLQGTFLFVTGDTGANTITITDSGTATGVGVVGDDVPYVATSPITHVFVDTLDGDDTVVYNLTGPLAVNRLVDAQLGLGVDSFTVNLTGQSLAALVNLDITAYGGDRGGRDTMVLNAQRVSTNEDSILNVFFEGAGGKDTIVLDYSPGAVALGRVILEKDQRH